MACKQIIVIVVFPAIHQGYNYFSSYYRGHHTACHYRERNEHGFIALLLNTCKMSAIHSETLHFYMEE